MKRNLGRTDRIIRGVAGAILAIAGIFYMGTWWGIALLIVGLILIITGILGFCTLYRLFNWSTLKK